MRGEYEVRGRGRRNVGREWDLKLGVNVEVGDGEG